MGYLYLTLALAGGLLKGFAGKRLSNDINGLKDCVFLNLLRMVFCAAIGFILLCLQADSSVFTLTSRELPVYIFSSVSTVLFVVIYMFAYKVSAYMYLSILGLIGSVITSFLGYFIYNESIGVAKLIGMVFLFAAVVIMSGYERKSNQKISLAGVIILIFVALSSALSDFSQKVYVNEIGGDAKVFSFYTYLFGAILLLIIFPFTRGHLKKTDGQIVYDTKHLLICGLISVGLYINSYFKTFAAAYLTSAQIYPVLQGANLIASAILSHILLKEKINKRSFTSIVCAIIGLLAMHIN